MPDSNVDTLKIILGFEDNASPGMKAAGENAENMGNKVKKSGDHAGMTERQFGKLGRYATQSLMAISGSTSKMNADLANTVTKATQIGQAFMFGGIVGAGIATAGLAIGALVQQTPAVERLNSELLKLGEPTAAQGLQELFSVSKDTANAMLLAAQNSSGYRIELAGLVKETEKAHDPTARLVDDTGNLVDKWKEGIYWGQLLVGQLQLIWSMANRKYNVGGGTGGSSGFGLDPQALAREAEALNENKRVMDIWKAGIPRAADEVRRLTKELKSLSDAHVKAQKGFTEDLAAAWKRLTDQISDIQIKSAQRIVSIQSDLLDQIGELEHNALDSNTESYYQYAKSIRELNYDLVRQAQDDAKKRLQIETELADDIAGITRDSAEREMTAPWSEVMKIRRERDARLKEANDKAKKARTDLTDEQSKRQEDFNHRRMLMDEEYLHSKELRDHDLREAIEKAQAQANKQIAEARRAEAEQIKAANDRYAEEKAAIEKRSADETAAYTKAVADAKAASAEQVKAILDTRTEAQRLRDDWDAVKGSTDKATQAAIIYSQALASFGLLNPISGNWSEWKIPGWYQTEPGQFKTVPGPASKAVPAIVHGGEVIGRPGKGTSGMNFYNCTFRDKQDVIDALAEYEKRK